MHSTGTPHREDLPEGTFTRPCTPQAHLTMRTFWSMRSHARPRHIYPSMHSTGTPHREDLPVHALQRSPQRLRRGVLKLNEEVVAGGGVQQLLPAVCTNQVVRGAPNCSGADNFACYWPSHTEEPFSCRGTDSKDWKLFSLTSHSACACALQMPTR